MVEHHYDEDGELLEYDEDGNAVDNGCVLMFSKMKISVVEKPAYKTIGVYNNFADAIEKCNEIENGFLSF